MPSKLATERLWLGHGGRVDVERVEYMDSSKEQRSEIDAEILWRTRTKISCVLSRLKAGRVACSERVGNVSNVQNVQFGDLELDGLDRSLP